MAEEKTDISKGEFTTKQKNIMYIVVIIIIVLILIRNRYKIKQLFTANSVDNSASDQISMAEVPESRKAYIRTVAQEIKEDIYSTSIWGHWYGAYDNAIGFSDPELKYLATYWKSNMSEPLGVSLYSDISSQTYMFGSSADQLKDKLSNVGENN